jgi:hypothetical protein
MKSVPQSRISPVLTACLPHEVVGSLRLELKPATGPPGIFDGAWWPRSRDLSSEVPSLVTGLAARSGRITRIGFNIGMWDSAPRRLLIEGQAVRLEGFHSQDKHAVTATAADGQRWILLVIPPEASAVQGRVVFARVAAGGNAADACTILAEGGVLPARYKSRIPNPRSEEQESRDRWESEGGQVEGA